MFTAEDEAELARLESATAAEQADRRRLAQLRADGRVSTLSAMSKTRSQVLEESRKKGIVAGATTAGAVECHVCQRGQRSESYWESRQRHAHG